MKYYNETQEEYIQRLTKQYAKALSKVYKENNIYKSDTDIWKEAEREVQEHIKRGQE